jgi:ABC-type glycerol-3-phosphate transport system permease component
VPARLEEAAEADGASLSRLFPDHLPISPAFASVGIIIFTRYGTNSSWRCHFIAHHTDSQVVMAISGHDAGVVQPAKWRRR